ncbi:MAG: hypothetical protein GY714_05690 [Desulfobacterales bacterium]|nr:hypothetical protein [Desulfobacterales bacterium]MCP4161114.1 hypothetical protein [Deltaproteobacteria bacterium]
MRPLVLLLSIIILLAVPTSSYALLDLGVEVAVGISKSRASGKFNYRQSSTFDLETNFGFDETDNNQVVRIKIFSPRLLPNIYYTHLKMDFDGVSKDLTYTGVDVGTGAFTKLDIFAADCAFFYRIPAVGLSTAGILEAEIGLNIRFLTLDAEVGTEDKTNFSAPIPQLYASLELDLTFLPIILQGEVRTLAVNEDNECSSFTARLLLEIPSPMALGEFFIAGGVRRDIYKINADSVKADTKFDTYFAEIGYKF